VTDFPIVLLLFERMRCAFCRVIFLPAKRLEEEPPAQSSRSGSRARGTTRFATGLSLTLLRDSCKTRPVGTQRSFGQIAATFPVAGFSTSGKIVKICVILLWPA
jgi:hypothetical protein